MEEIGRKNIFLKLVTVSCYDDLIANIKWEFDIKKITNIFETFEIDNLSEVLNNDLKRKFL